jgi:hypothetical protein
MCTLLKGRRVLDGQLRELESAGGYEFLPEFGSCANEGAGWPVER